MANRKLFVLDTNVPLHDSQCIYHFEENDIAIPITVIEELDSFKKGNESLNYHAREFLRAVDALSSEPLFAKGVKIGDGLGHLMVKVGQDFHPDLKLSFDTRTADHEILNIAYRLARKQPRRQVILVSKDVNLRMKAKAIGLTAQDYRSDHVKDISALYHGVRLYEHISEQIIDRLYAPPHSVNVDELSLDPAPLPNEGLILRNGRKSALATFDSERKQVRQVNKVGAYGITPRNAEQAFALNALLNPDVNAGVSNQRAGGSLLACNAFRAAANSARLALPTSGYSRSSDASASMTAPATTARVNHLWSAGTTYQGAQGVAVARIISS
jgi:PhoH-like ATPase